MEKQKFIVKVSYVKFYEVFADNHITALNNAVYAVEKIINPDNFNEIHAEIIEPNLIPLELELNN